MKIKNLEKILFYVLILFLPTQLGKHFWPDSAIVSGIRIDYLSPTLYFTDGLIILLFGCWVIRKVQSSKIPPIRRAGKVQGYNAKFKILLFLGILLIGVLLSGRDLGGLYFLLKLLEFLFLGYYAARALAKKGVFQMVAFLFSLGVIYESFLAIAQFIKQGSIGSVFYYFGERTFTSQTPGIAVAYLNSEVFLRPYATFSHPNVLAGYLVIGMTIAFSAFSSFKKLWIKRLSLISILFGTVALLLTMSRTATLLWIIFVIVYLLNKSKKLGLLGGVGILGGLLLTPLGQRFFIIGFGDEALVQRQKLLGAAFEMIDKNPLLGVGLGNFIPSLAAIQDMHLLQPVHNIFILVLVETGIIGLSVFVWFLIKTYKRTKNEEPRTKNLKLTLLFSAIILGLFDHYFLTLQQGQLLLALVLSLCWARIPAQGLEKFSK